MKRILIALISSSILSSCAWFTSKPIPEIEEPKPKAESEMAAELESEAENHVSNGITYHQDGNDSLAILSWKKALELLPGDAEIHNFIGIAYHKSNNFDEAIKHFKIATDLDPTYYHALDNMGFLLLLQQKYVSAKNAFQKALEQNSDYEPSKRNLQTVNEMLSGNLSKDVFELSQNVEAIEDLDEKIKKYKEILSLDSTFAQNHNNIGVAYYYKYVEGNGDDNDSSYYAFLDSAYAHLNKSLELNKNNPEAINNLGWIYTISGRYDDAIKLFLRAISSKKEYIVALNNLGETYRLNSEFENARRVFKTVLDLDPANEFAMDSFEILMEKEEK
jgi:protein O-GlcNAc transferase